jgi:hypothetical protein
MNTVPKYRVGLKYSSEDDVKNGIISYGPQSDFHNHHHHHHH